MRVSYLYNLSLPSPRGAQIQTLKTCHALAVAGIPTTLFSGELRDDSTSCLAFYGLEPHPDFVIRPLFSRLDWRLWPPWPLARMLAEHDDGRPHIMLSRDVTALELASWLRPIGRRQALFVYEAHRLCFARQAEHLSGRRWDGAVALPMPHRRTYERERATVEGADGVVCLTEGMRETLMQLFNVTAPILVLPSGTSVPADDATARWGERDIDVLYLGKLMARKGVPLLIAAMSHLPGRRLCVLGGSPDDVAACRELATAYGVESRIDFTGFVEPRRVQDYLRRARVGVCPLPTGVSIISERFTSPLKLLEMMAHNVPVVASDLPVTRAIVTHGESALLVRPDDPVALAAGIRRLLDDRALAERLAAGARRRVMAFSWQERARRLREFLEGLANHHRAGARAAE